MTHNKLLASIEDKFNNHSGKHDAEIVNALYRVVELHKPTGWFEDTGYADQECVHCDNGSYPCQTIKVIELNLQ